MSCSASSWYVFLLLTQAASGDLVQQHPLGTDPPPKEDIVMQAARRLSAVAHGAEGGWTNLSHQVDASLVANSGFTTAAPSRGAPPEDYDTDSDADEIDLNIAAQNTRATQGVNAAGGDAVAEGVDPFDVAPVPGLGKPAVPSSETHPGAAPPITNPFHLS